MERYNLAEKGIGRYLIWQKCESVQKGKVRFWRKKYPDKDVLITIIRKEISDNLLDPQPKTYPRQKIIRRMDKLISDP